MIFLTPEHFIVLYAVCLNIRLYFDPRKWSEFRREKEKERKRERMERVAEPPPSSNENASDSRVLRWQREETTSSHFLASAIVGNRICRFLRWQAMIRSHLDRHLHFAAQHFECAIVKMRTHYVAPIRKISAYARTVNSAGDVYAMRHTFIENYECSTNNWFKHFDKHFFGFDDGSSASTFFFFTPICISQEHTFALDNSRAETYK